MIKQQRKPIGLTRWLPRYYTTRHSKEGDVKHLCDLMLDIIKSKRKPSEVKVDVLALKKEFCGVKYGFQSVEEALKYVKNGLKASFPNLFRHFIF